MYIDKENLVLFETRTFEFIQDNYEKISKKIIKSLRQNIKRHDEDFESQLYFNNCLMFLCTLPFLLQNSYTKKSIFIWLNKIQNEESYKKLTDDVFQSILEMQRENYIFIREIYQSIGIGYLGAFTTFQDQFTECFIASFS